jgi:hypothetical protein
MMSSFISERNSSNVSFYKRHGCRASLLCHPAGLKVLKGYAKLMKNGLSDTALVSAKSLAMKLANVVRDNRDFLQRNKETSISTCLTEAIQEGWCQSHYSDYTSTLGESEKNVQGQRVFSSQSPTSGNPETVVRMAPSSCLYLSREQEKKKIVQLIIEVSVDQNGGEKKVDQAFDYAASLIEGNGQTLLLFTFQIDRSNCLQITHEAFLYLHSQTESEREMGFLWREVYTQQDKETDLAFLEKSCEGVVRCLECSTIQRNCAIDYPSQWKVASDNAVIFTDRNANKYVYKVFDNRFHPTHRRPDEWLKNERTWIQSLGGVETEFEFKESIALDTLGWPAKGKRARDSDSPKSQSHTSYPNGSVLVIKYAYVKGTHFASRVSHFLDIARCISEMHGENMVHGDVRGFNMLHPYPADSEEFKDGIEHSLLIDFDLSGLANSEEYRYPPGYQTSVIDNAFERSGVAGEKMQKMDDWKDLGAVMSHYSISDSAITSFDEYKEAKKAWVSLKKASRQIEGNAVGLLKNFIQHHDNLEIEMYDHLRDRMEEITVRGTGSPNKLQQQPIGRLSIDQSAN